MVERADGLDQMTLHCEVGAPGDGLARAIEESLRAATGLRGEVQLIAGGTLANDGKVIDDRRGRPTERPLLTAEELACVRGGRPVFDGLSFALAAGDALLLRGPNGSGKSSLLRLLAGFLPAGRGAARLGRRADRGRPRRPPRAAALRRPCRRDQGAR